MLVEDVHGCADVFENDGVVLPDKERSRKVFSSLRLLCSPQPSQPHVP